jgi:hypothetical protein
MPRSIASECWPRETWWHNKLSDKRSSSKPVTEEVGRLVGADIGTLTRLLPRRRARYTTTSDLTPWMR